MSYEEHESYGMVGIYHTNGGARPLFGSTLKHDRTVSLRIAHGGVDRKLHQEWYYAGKEIIEVELSQAQFTQLITTPNCGGGIPCTINHINQERTEKPPYQGHNELFNKELEEDFAKAMSGAESLLEDAREKLEAKGPMKVSEKKELLGTINGLVQHIQSNMPFLHKQFCRSMNKTVTSAKADIESFWMESIVRLGKEALIEDEGIPTVPQISEK